MNPDKIKKAVELADGFKILSNGCYWMEYDALSEQDPDSPFQYFIDALRCQLERQVDAIHHYAVVTYIEETIIEDWAPDDMTIIVSVRGPNRAENSINAILDSGVLEP